MQYCQRHLYVNYGERSTSQRLILYEKLGSNFTNLTIVISYIMFSAISPIQLNRFSSIFFKLNLFTSSKLQTSSRLSFRNKMYKKSTKHPKNRSEAQCGTQSGFFSKKVENFVSSRFNRNSMWNFKFRKPIHPSAHRLSITHKIH